MNIIEKILAAHAALESVKPGDIVDIQIDVRLARDFGGANVVQNIVESGLPVKNPGKTWFTFDCNPTGSDQKYAANQQICRLFARENGIGVFDINAGIGTHLAIDMGLTLPGQTAVSTDSHANILGAIGCFGQGMGDIDIAAAWAHGKVWFKVPESVKITLTGERETGISAKEIVLNLLHRFGANSLLGYSVELYGDEVEKLSLDERITIASMATEMGALAILIPPSEEIIAYCHERSGKRVAPVFAGRDAEYAREYELDISRFFVAVSRPGKPHDVAGIEQVQGVKIDSAFIGSCTNGRLEDMYVAAEILRGKKVAPGVVLKIVPSTDEIWNKCLEYGWISVFKEAGALVGNAGCAGCAAGQIGQNGPGEVTVSTGNRNFTGKQGKGDVYLVSPAVAAASAVAGYITTPDNLPAFPAEFKCGGKNFSVPLSNNSEEITEEKPSVIEGKVWLVNRDNIDTDMIYHNRFLTITRIEEMGQHTFGNLQGWEDYALNSEPGDILIAGKNFGSGSSRQQAVDCFISLKNRAILAQSFGAIYERNAINAGFPVLTYHSLDELALENRDMVRINLREGTLQNLRNGKTVRINAFSGVQYSIYKRGGLLKKG